MTFSLFSLWTFVLIGRPQDLFVALAALRPAFVLGALTLVFVFLGSPRAVFNSISMSPEARAYLAYFGVMIIAIPFAHHRSVAFNYIFTVYLTNVIFFVVFITIVDCLEKLKRLLSVISFCTVFYGVFGLMLGSFSSGRYVIYGAMFDPNDMAYVLVTLLPISLFFIVRRDGRFNTILAFGGVLASLVLILLTGSRGGLLSLGVILAILLLTDVGSVKLHYKLAFIIGIGTIGAFNFEKINFERYLTLMNMEQDYNVTSETGRLEVWKKGIELLLGNPLTGVGVQCFPMAIGYLRADANAIPEWQAAHNSYLQVAVETGLIGFMIFLSLIATCVRNLSKCDSIRPANLSTNDWEDIKALAGFMRLSWIGHLICAFFLSQGYSVLFALLFALSSVMRRLAATSVDAKDVRIARV